MAIKLIILGILTVSFLFELFMDVTEYRSASNPVPASAADIYDADTYKRWTAYHHEKVRVEIVSHAATYIITMLLLIFNVHAAFASLFGSGDYLQGFAVVLFQSVADLLLLPITYYDTMHVETKYGFNTSTKKTFFVDAVKEFLLGLAISVFLMSVCYFLYRWLGLWALPLFAAVMVLFVLLISFLSPKLMRISNKFVPLEDGPLKDGLTALLTRHGYHVRAIEVMDASKRTTKSNAAFSGFGKMKTIILYDNLVNSMTTDEIVAVFAHELGHGLHKDTVKMQWLNALQMLLIGALIMVNLYFPAICGVFGFSEVNYGFALLLTVSVELELLQPLLGLLINYTSRRAEYRADAQAVEEGYGAALISALKKLGKENFANLAPSPITVKLTYSHPPIDQRITAIEAALRSKE